MRLSVVAAIQLPSAKLDIVLAANESHVVSKLITPHDGDTGQEDLRSKIGKSWNIKSYLARSVGDNGKVGIVPLKTKFIQCSGAELMEP